MSMPESEIGSQIVEAPISQELRQLNDQGVNVVEMSIPQPHSLVDRFRSFGRRVVQIGVPVTLLIAAACSRGGDKPSQHLDSTPVQAVATATVTPEATVTPRVIITEAPKPPEVATQTPQEKIDTVKKLQDAAVAKGEVKLAQPQSFLDIGGRIEQSKPLPDGEIDLFLIAPPGKEVVIPAMIGGKVTAAERINASVNMITIQVGSQTFGMLLPRTSELLVQKGQEVPVGMPVVKVVYDSKSEIQKLFEADGAGRPPGTIALLGLQDASGAIQPLTLNNMLRDSAGKALAIPTTLPPAK